MVSSQLKLVCIRSAKSQMRLLMDIPSAAQFQCALSRTIGEAVFVVNTNIGMEVYYLSKTDFRDFIQQKALLYSVREGARVPVLKFKSLAKPQLIFSKFKDTMMMFSKYPQVFLAYCKKFVFLLEKNRKRTPLVQMLALFYAISLQQVRRSGKIPHLHKINRISKRSNALLAADGHFSLKRMLATKLLSKAHVN